MYKCVSNENSVCKSESFFHNYLNIQTITLYPRMLNKSFWLPSAVSKMCCLNDKAVCVYE